MCTDSVLAQPGSPWLGLARSHGRAGLGVRVASVGAILFTTTGCPGTLENKDDFLGQGGATSTGTTTGQSGGGTPADDPCGGLITERCAVPGCHVPERTPPDLSYTGRVERLVGVESPVCGGPLVDTANPEASVLYRCV